MRALARAVTVLFALLSLVGSTTASAEDVMEIVAPTTSADLGEVLEVVVTAEDGTELHGWVGLPDEAVRGARVPVVLESTPYLGDCVVFALASVPPCSPTPSHEAWTPATASWWSDSPPQWATEQWGIPPIELVRRGYAAAFFNVRGSGKSGGCLELFGPNEQRDQVTLVEWLGRQSWSSGRVAMGGDSYAGTTAFEAAIHSTGKRSPLKAIVPSVPVTDAYTQWHTPQGANVSQNLWGWAPWPQLTLTPAAGGGPADAVESASKTPERACADVVKVLTLDKTEYVEAERDAVFFGDRALIDRFPKITAAVLLHDGFNNLGQPTQDSAVWESLVRAPKRHLQTRRDHELESATYDPSWIHNDWEKILFGWLDYWLKGTGDREALRIGTADYLDDAGTWRASGNWPPAEAREQVMYLADDALSPTPGSGSRSFTSVNDPRNNSFTGQYVVEKDTGGVLEQTTGVQFRPSAALCGDQPIATGTPALTYVTEPLEQAVTIAGNPFAYLRLASDQEGGLVQVQVSAIRGDQQCDALGTPVDSKFLTLGVADLRYYRENLVAQPFPIDRRVNVRIDLWDLASKVEAGERIAVVVSGSAGPPIEWMDPRYSPRVTVDSTGGLEASHLVLPLVEGTLGGHAPKLKYPPRPFVPQRGAANSSR